MNQFLSPTAYWEISRNENVMRRYRLQCGLSTIFVEAGTSQHCLDSERHIDGLRRAGALYSFCTVKKHNHVAPTSSSSAKTWVHL